MIPNKKIEKIRKIFKIISHPTRIALLEFLEDFQVKGIYYNAIKIYFHNISESTLRYHLKKLIDVNYIIKSGNNYFLTDLGRKILIYSRKFKKAMEEFDND